MDPLVLCLTSALVAGILIGAAIAFCFKFGPFIQIIVPSLILMGWAVFLDAKIPASPRQRVVVTLLLLTTFVFLGHWLMSKFLHWREHRQSKTITFF